MNPVKLLLSADVWPALRCPANLLRSRMPHESARLQIQFGHVGASQRGRTIPLGQLWIEGEGTLTVCCVCVLCVCVPRFVRQGFRFSLIPYTVHLSKNLSLIHSSHTPRCLLLQSDEVLLQSLQVHQNRRGDRVLDRR